MARTEKKKIKLPKVMQKSGSGKSGKIMRAILLRVFTIAILVVTCWFVFHELKAYVMGMDKFYIEKSSLKLASKPVWVTPEIERQIVEVPELPEKFNILEPNITEKIHASYQNNPWVKGNVIIKKEYPNKLKLSLTLRKPVVFVKCGDYFYLTDSDGVRLPIKSAGYPVKEFYDLPFILRTDAKLPQIGQKWQGDDVCGGIHIATLLKRGEICQKLKITGIDVGNVGGTIDRAKSEIVLYTNEGTKIRWGKPPFSDSPGELSATDKIKQLKSVLHINNDFSSYEYLDIRFNPPVYKLREGAIYSGLD